MPPLYEFTCPDCARSCLLNDATNAMQHELPMCNTYKKTKADGQKFLELAFAAGCIPKEVKPACLL